MKNKLLPLIFVLGGYSAYSQVGIGTTMPNASSQLEVVANDKGILIPRVKLKNSTDVTTIANGNINSLLIFNTAAIADVKPGYYYWYDNKWNRIIAAGEIESNTGTVIYNPVTNEFVYVDESGNNQTLSFETIVKKYETITIVTNHNNGTYTYANEKGDKVVIDVPADVANNFETIVNNPAVTNVLNTFITKVEGNVSYNPVTNEFTYTDKNGDIQVVNISDIVKANETITILTNHNNGTYTYANEKGDKVVIDVPADVANNFETIVNNPAVTNVLNTFITKAEGNVSYNPVTNEFTYTDKNGDIQVVNISEIVKANETITILTNHNNGTYTYANEKGDKVVIDVPADVANNFETIVNNPAVTNVLNTFITKVEGNVSYNPVTNEFTYTDKNGDTQVVNISEIVKANETVTTLANNNNGTYLYTSEDKTPTTIDVVADVINNASTIVNDPKFITEVTNVVKTEETVTTLANNNNGTYLYTSEDKTPTTIDVVADVINNASTIVNDPKFITEVTNVVKTEETVTTLANNNNGTYLYTSEDKTPTTIDVVADVINNASTIINDSKFVTELTNVIKNEETLTSLSYDDTAHTLIYKDEKNQSKVFELKDLVGDAETQTTLVYDASAKTLTYNGESGTPTVIQLVDLVGAAETVTTLANNNNGTYLYTSEDKTPTTIDVVADVINNASTIVNDPKFITEVTNVVKTEETVTTLANNNNGTYLYTSEDKTPTTIDVVADVINNASTIVNDSKFVTELTNVIKNEETLTSLSYDDTAHTLTYKDEKNQSKVFELKDLVGDAETQTTLVYDASAKTLTYNGESGTPTVIQLVDLVGAAETVTTLANNNNGTYLYTSEDKTPTTIDVVADVINNASTIVNDSKFVTELTNVIKNEETLTSLSYDDAAHTLTYKDEKNQSKVFELKDLVGDAETQTTLVYDASAKTLTYNGESGTPTVIQLVDLVGAAETVTTLANNNNGTYLYTSEDKTPTTIDVVADVINNASTIVNDPKFVTELTNVIKNEETLTSLSYDDAAHTLTYKDEKDQPTVFKLTDLVGDAETQTTLVYDASAKTLTYNGESGMPTVIQLVDLVGAAETVTTLANNNNGTYLYTSEDKTPTTIDVVADVINNASTIVNDSKFVTELTNVIKNEETLTSLSYDDTAHTLTYKDEKNQSKVFELKDLVGDAETQTTLVYDAPAKTLTYNGESGTPTVIQLVDLVGAAETVTTVTPVVTTGNTIATYTNEAGGTPVEIKETVTSLVHGVTQETDVNGQVIDKHTLTYTDENNVANPIDLSVLVKGTETLTSLVYDGAEHALIYNDEKGNASEFKLVDLVGDAETITTLEVNSATGTLDYMNESKVVKNIDLSNAVKEPWFSSDTKVGATLNTENIYTQGWVGIGYTEPSNAVNEKLRVNGSITTVNSFYADYVFEDYFQGFSQIKADYKFKQLAEIEDFIKKNKHLPGITPINELQKTKEGYSFNMSELSIQLLEKTEEIYLHIIEQNKINELQSKEIEAKDKIIKELKEASDSMNQRLEKLEKFIAEKVN